MRPREDAGDRHAGDNRMSASDGNKGLYDHLYGRFFKNRSGSKGYDFQHQTAGNEPPRPVTFAARLRWWTLDRWKRRRTLRQERDQRLREILQFRDPHIPPPKSE